MNTTARVRRAHRLIAVTFVATLVVTVLVLALRGPQWVSYLPLAPLAGLFVSGAWMYVRGRRRPVIGRARQVHRWSGVVFTLAVLATIVALSLPDPIVWVSYLPLIPLAALLFTGLFMLVSPVRARRTA
ncbi:hypothetical protein ACSVDM_01080 [Nocardia sp. JW2]|uniref:hypothetical protein n=1 Tax=Nocardia sp. JW2 TaxID=3450738 RepID=UPI003F440EFA